MSFEKFESAEKQINKSLETLQKLAQVISNNEPYISLGTLDQKREHVESILTFERLTKSTVELMEAYFKAEGSVKNFRIRLFHKELTKLK